VADPLPLIAPPSLSSQSAGVRRHRPHEGSYEGSHARRAAMPRRERRLPAGSSLIEVLVSIVIASIGVLALAGLLTTASRYAKTSEIRATATLLASDLADRLRGNAGAVEAGAYDLSAAFASAPPPPPVPPACAATSPCAPGQMAAVDLAGWRARLRSRLPEGSGSVRFNAPTGAAIGSVDLWVAWRDPTTGAERPADECPASMAVVADAAVRCVHLQVGLR